jgi:hypothetical protein
MPAEDPVAARLRTAPTTDAVRAQVWDAYQAATSPDDFAAKVKDLPLPTAIKADLWDLKAARPAADTAAPAAGPGMNFAIVNGQRVPLNGLPRDIQAQLQDHSQQGDMLLDNVKRMGKGALNLLPAAGGIVGGALSAPETGGAGTPIGWGLGTGAGVGLRDLIAQGTGLEPTTTPTDKAVHIGRDTVLADVGARVIPAAADALHELAPLNSLRDAATALQARFDRLSPELQRRFLPKLLGGASHGIQTVLSLIGMLDDAVGARAPAAPAAALEASPPAYMTGTASPGAAPPPEVPGPLPLRMTAVPGPPGTAQVPPAALAGPPRPVMPNTTGTGAPAVPSQMPAPMPLRVNAPPAPPPAPAPPPPVVAARPPVVATPPPVAPPTGPAELAPGYSARNLPALPRGYGVDARQMPATLTPTELKRQLAASGFTNKAVSALIKEYGPDPVKAALVKLVGQGGYEAFKRLFF